MGATLSSILSWMQCAQPHRIMMCCNVETVEHGNISFRAWDLNTHERLRPLWRHYYPDTSAVIFVVDSVASERFTEAKEELQLLVEDSELKEACPFLILANKQDLPEAASPSVITEALELHRLKRPWFIQGTSSLDSRGINESLDWLAKAVTK
ncbi:uncharacterized protein LOC135195412 isoform X2 [Macrobrachium nipponense]|uniref:uncharacterized protein LOC135195412 isoform X2 n=1 Tax=Macrobrachium nipponense TaxID=159736 RepID=UPI0030C84129